MKTLKKALQTFCLALALSLVVPAVFPAAGEVAAVSAASRISKKSVTLSRGESVRLKVTGTSKKIKWSSSKKSVASVTAKGKVTAKKSGTAIITAKFGKKKLTCRVIVKKAASNNKNPGNQSGSHAQNRPDPDTPTQSPSVGDSVWIPRTGSKYHRTPDCGGMNSPTQVSRSEAISMGYEPCKRCY